MTHLDALLGKIRYNGADIELGAGLNFTGIGVVVALNPDTLMVDVTISGGGGGTGHVIANRGSNLGTRPTLNFAYPLRGTDNGVNNRTDIDLQLDGSSLSASASGLKVSDFSAASRVHGRGSAAGAGAVQELTVGVGVRINATQIELSAALAPLATLGTALQQPRVNAAATALEYFTPGATNAQSGTTYTLVIGDADKDIRCTNAAGCNVTVPPASSVAFPTDVLITLVGTQGQVTVTQGAGVTVNKKPSCNRKSSEAFAGIALKYRGSDVWDLFGDLELT